MLNRCSTTRSALDFEWFSTCLTSIVYVDTLCRTMIRSHPVNAESCRGNRTRCTIQREKIDSVTLNVEFHHRMNLPRGVFGHVLAMVALIFRSVADVPKCSCGAARRRCNNECHHSHHCAVSYHVGVAVWSTKSLDASLSRTPRHRLASSLPAEVTGPLTFFPLGETAKGSLANNHQSKTKD